MRKNNSYVLPFLTDHILEKILCPEYDHKKILKKAQRDLKDEKTKPDEAKIILETTAEKLRKDAEKLQKAAEKLQKGANKLEKDKNLETTRENLQAAQEILQEEDLQDAREIVMKILKRDLPKFLGEAKMEKRDKSKVFDRVKLK